MSRRPAALTGSSLLILLVVAHATNDSFSGMLAALLPTFQVRFGVSEAVLAALVGTLSFSSSVMQPLFGAVADRLGRRAVGAAGVVTSSALLSLMGAVQSVWLRFPLLRIGGLGSSSVLPSGASNARTPNTRRTGWTRGRLHAG